MFNLLTKKSLLLTALFFIFCALVLFAALRGLPGNPTAGELNTMKWKENGPLELSPDRGRYALLYSLVEDRTVQFSLDIARFATPDVGYFDGRYVSLFAPGLSFLLIPGYLLGKFFGLAQIGAAAVIALFAIANAALIRTIALRLRASPAAAAVGAAVFLFATPAFAYGVSLYQHHISTFLILSSLYLLLRARHFFAWALVWAAFGLSISIDYPNLFLMLPLVILLLRQMITVRLSGDRIHFRLPLRFVLPAFAVILPLAFFLWFNQASYGNPLQSPGTITAVQEIDEAGQPAQSRIVRAIPGLQGSEVATEKTAVGFFKTRNLLNGFYTHFFSLDRGIIYFTPVILLGIWGLALGFRRNPAALTTIWGIIGANLLLYSMWGDPYGGWAFGSRYLIPSYALLAIGVGLLLTHLRRNYIFLALFLLLFGYSTWVNSLGAITSSSNPPKIEVLALEQVSGREEKYTYERNLDLLRANVSKSFLYQNYLRGRLPATTYHWIIVSSIVLIVAGLLLYAAIYKPYAPK